MALAVAIPAAESTPCHVTAFADIPSAVQSCTNLILDGITVPANSTLDLNGLQNGATVKFAGRTFFEYTSTPPKALVEISGSGITVGMVPGAAIDGNGQSWWDGQGSNGGRPKPDHFIQLAKLKNNSVVEDLHITNWPVHCFYVNGCTDTVIRNLHLDNSAGNAPNSFSNGLPAAHNTDGFDVSSCQNVQIMNSSVSNQDDCVAVTSGNNVTVSNMLCEGGHGLSIGSVGGKSNNNVTNILFRDSVIANSENGARIKTNSGTTGYVHGVTYDNILLKNISIYGIDIQQDYLNGGPNGVPTNGVILDGITMRNIYGTVQSGADNVYILCGQGSCSNFEFDNVHISGGENVCNYEPQGESCSSV